MGDVKKDTEDSMRMKINGEKSLMLAFDLDNTIIRIFEDRIKKENPKISKKELAKKIQEELFYGRRDNSY